MRVFHNKQPQCFRRISADHHYRARTTCFYFVEISQYLEPSSKATGVKAYVHIPSHADMNVSEKAKICANPKSLCYELAPLYVLLHRSELSHSSSSLIINLPALAESRNSIWGLSRFRVIAIGILLNGNMACFTYLPDLNSSVVVHRWNMDKLHVIVWKSWKERKYDSCRQFVLEKGKGKLRAVCRRTVFEQSASAICHRVDAIYFSPLDTVHTSVFTANPSSGKNASTSLFRPEFRREPTGDTIYKIIKEGYLLSISILFPVHIFWKSSYCELCSRYSVESVEFSRPML
jgi:hypothetical protein